MRDVLASEYDRELNCNCGHAACGRCMTIIGDIGDELTVEVLVSDELGQYIDNSGIRVSRVALLKSLTEAPVLCKCGLPATHINEADPYQEAINDDYTPCNLCDDCYQDSCDEV